MLVSEAAKKLRMNPQTLRLGIQQKLFPFGEAIVTTKAENSKVGKDRYTYYINEAMFEAYLKGVRYEPNVLENHHYNGVDCCDTGVSNHI